MPIVGQRGVGVTELQCFCAETVSKDKRDTQLVHKRLEKHDLAAVLPNVPDNCVLSSTDGNVATFRFVERHEARVRFAAGHNVECSGRLIGEILFGEAHF